MEGLILIISPSYIRFKDNISNFIWKIEHYVIMQGGAWDFTEQVPCTWIYNTPQCIMGKIVWDRWLIPVRAINELQVVINRIRQQIVM